MMYYTHNHLRPVDKNHSLLRTHMLQPTRTRWLGLIPLLLFLTNALYDAHLGRIADSLWICHVAGLFLAMGILFEMPMVVRVAMVCLIPGIGFWIMGMLKTHVIITTS